jgi:hypothetical protein
MTDSTRRQLILDAERLAKDHMEKYDPSHDWFHGKNAISFEASTARLGD